MAACIAWGRDVSAAFDGVCGPGAIKNKGEDDSRRCAYGSDDRFVRCQSLWEGGTDICRLRYPLQILSGIIRITVGLS
jgi:hypothetical protein